MTNVLVTGRVGTDPELRYTPQGTPVLNFQLAEDHRRYNEQTKEWETQDGAKGKTLELSASLVAVPLYPPRDTNAAQTQQGQYQAPAQPAQGAPAQQSQLQQQVSAWPTATAGGFAQQTDPWAQAGSSEEPPF